MAFGEDIKTILNQVGTNLVGNLKDEYGDAAIASATSGSIQPLVKFYNDNEQELRDKYGISLNQILGMNENFQNTLIEYGTPKMGTPISELANTNPNNSTNIMREFALPILGIIAGGAAVLIIIKTLKK